MPLINFLLKHPDDIIPFGTESDKSLHWFGLTDGNLWLEAGKSKLYEYTDSFLALLSLSDTKYVDYYLSRFIEDFTEQFEKIATELPDESYAIAKNSMTLTKFQETSKQWLDETNERDFDQAIEKYDALIGWIGQRELTAGHLVGSPHIGFFKNKNKISIVWKADQRTKKNIPLWTAQNGEIEMDYPEFVAQIEDFGDRFFSAMADQVEIALKKDWGAINIDKSHLVEEHHERQTEFANRLRHLRHPG
jgi:hypothetical protein